LLLLAACGQGAAEKDSPRESAEPDTLRVSEAPNAEHVAKAAQTSPTDSAPEGRYHLAWAGDDRLCGESLAVLNRANKETDARKSDSVGYAERQAQTALHTPQNIKWTAGEGGDEHAMLEYFNDGVSRTIERRRGKLSGNQVITLWVGSGEGEYTHLSFGHAGANTPGLPALENLNTKLTYSVVDVAEINNRFVTLVAPLSDFDATGSVFVATWTAKTGREKPFAAEDYYPLISCVFTSVGG